MYATTTNCQLSGCDKRLTIEHILLTCSDFIEIRESHFTARSLRMLFQDILPEKIFNFLKEINIFGKKYKFEIIFSYIYVIHLLSMVLKLYI